MESQEQNSKKIIRTFAAASFLNDMGSDIIYPVWPLFVTSVLKANMAALGFLDGLGDALVSISKAASGYISDKIKRRKIFIWTGYLCGALSRLGYAFSSVWTHLIPFRILDRAGKIRGAPRDALVGDVSTQKDRGKNFGLLRAMDHLGAVCGIIICIIFFKILGYRLLFALAAIPSLLSVLLIYFIIKERRSGKIKIYKGLSLKDLDKNFRLFLLISSIFSLGAFSYSFLLIYAKKFGFEVTFVPVLYLIFTASASLFSYPLGRLSDKIGRKPVIVLSFLLWGLVCISIIFGRSHFVIICSFLVYGAHKGALEPVQKTFVCELSPQRFRASGLGAFQMIIGLCAFPASFIAGVLWETLGMFAPFYFSFILVAICSVMLLFVKRKKPDF
ncbi:MAG: MFS transporter [Candidatus Aminicenantaceae bacterium]